MAVLLALCSALAYGLSDFIGGILSRRTSAWSVAVVGQSSSAVCTSLVALLVAGDPRPSAFAWGVVAGVGGGMGTGFLYRGFASGRMGVVAPVSAVGAALVPVLTGTVTGERPSTLVWLGIVAAIPGIWLVSSSPDTPGGRGSLAEGVLDGVLAGLGFGVLFAALGQVPDSAGWWPLAVCQVVSVPAVVTLLATQHGFLTVAGILASLYPASTVLLAALVLHERIHRAQGVGLALCAVAVAFVGGG